MTIEQMRGPKINLFNCCATSKQETREANLAELLQKMQALRTKIVLLRQQCEEVKATINIKPKNQATRANAVNSTKHSKAATFSVAPNKKCYVKTALQN